MLSSPAHSSIKTFTHWISGSVHATVANLPHHPQRSSHLRSCFEKPQPTSGFSAAASACTMSETGLLQASRAPCTHWQRPLLWRGAHKKAPCAVLCGATAVRSVRGRSPSFPSVAGRPAVASMVSSSGHSAHESVSAVGGALVAIVTPMRQDGGIDEAALREYLQVGVNGQPNVLAHSVNTSA